MNWEYQGEFLKQFNDYERNMATQIVCRAYRGLNENYKHSPMEDREPCVNLTQMLKRLDREITERAANEWISVELRVLLAKLTVQMESDELKDFCRFIAKREKIDPELKLRFKEQNQKVYAQKAMSKVPPTEKQIYWIKKKGGTVPATKLEATKLLDKLFAKA